MLVAAHRATRDVRVWILTVMARPPSRTSRWPITRIVYRRLGTTSRDWEIPVNPLIFFTVAESLLLTIRRRQKATARRITLEVLQETEFRNIITQSLQD
jgi:hypothetical protein